MRYYLRIIIICYFPFVAQFTEKFIVEGNDALGHIQHCIIECASHKVSKVQVFANILLPKRQSIHKLHCSMSHVVQQKVK